MTGTSAALPVRDASFHVRLLQQYLFLLKKYPVLTKSVTSGILSALGNLLSQVLEVRKKGKHESPTAKMDVAGAARYAIYGLFITGPVSHVFYQLMETWIPTTDPYCIIKRLLLDRLFFAPGFLLLFYFVMNILESSWACTMKLDKCIRDISPLASLNQTFYITEQLYYEASYQHIHFTQVISAWAKGWVDFERKMRQSYWTALKMNWKVWTPFQFVNINFVPVQFRVLFANMVALFWYAYLASVRK